MKNKVLSVRQMKVLKSIYDPLENMKPLNVWVNHYGDSDVEYDLHVWDACIKPEEHEDWYIKTLTAEEVIDILPDTYIVQDEGKSVEVPLHLEKLDGEWFVEYKKDGIVYLSHKGKTLLEASYNLLVWMLTNLN